MSTPTPSANRQAEDPSVTKAKTAKDVVGAFASMAGASSSKGGTKDPLVYLGTKKHTPMYGSSSYYAAQSAGAYDNTVKLSEVANQYYNWDGKTKNKFLTQLGLAGYDTSGMKDSQIAQLWGNYAAQAAQYFQQGRRLTPWDILAKDRDQREAYMNTPRTVTQSSTSYDMSTREDAHGIFLQAAQSLLGRDPTKSEITAFQKALNAYEKANPTTTTQTSNYIGDTLQSQSSTTTGGVKEGARQLMALEDVKADPEYGAYQAATTYFDAMMEMIGG
ncbi:hypothetical protein SEA_OLICIOUS_10 [Streptomyces phage Olicious]|uniref:Uncharacterized protein n=1 Tax=Streptomyces phage Olicious TaxID=2488981 RepID=A0A3G8FP81_9CAUD|nr:hypothetical protein SEA_OLICIOUS_10 [Streptomyces phage Olicious]UJQ86868.1 hypothetical protein SEA_TREAT_10 [Streptomyces phage Treat]